MMLRPILPEITNSELVALMATGMATVAGSILATFTKLGVLNYYNLHLQRLFQKMLELGTNFIWYNYFVPMTSSNLKNQNQVSRKKWNLQCTSI